VASLAAGALLGLGYLLRHAADLDAGTWLIWVSLGIGMVYGGRPAVISLARLRFDIDVLMVVGAGLAAYIGHPEEGALLLFLFVLSGALEDLAQGRTRREVEALHKLMPTDALVERDGAWALTDAGTLRAGERIRVRPGERVPADALVVAGESTMDQSAITGESMPRHVRPGDELFAGTINTDDPLEARVLRPVAESSLQKILNMVTQAQERREPVQRLIDRLNEPYALGVLGVSTLIALVWWLALDFPLVGDGRRPGALYTAITFLIVASPCALVIATPTATLAAIARAARGGVLLKGGQAIERLARVRSVGLDKTGTLTYGRPRLYEVHPVAWSDGAELLSIASALERDSTHPIAAAIREAAEARGVAPAEVRDVNHVTAKGIEGVYRGNPVRLGNYPFAEPLTPICLRNRVKEVLGRIQDRGHVGVVVAMREPGPGPQDVGGQAAVLIMADAARPGAGDLVRDLHAQGVRPVRMLTGDNRITAERVGASLGLDGVDAELLPEDKLRIVDQMRAAGRGGVAVIGDGVNDAPALAASDAAIAMGTIGTAAAMDAADAVLISDNLAAIPWSIRLSRRTRRTIALNFAVALGLIAVMGTWTLWGSVAGRPVPLAAGVLAHEGGTLIVVLNSLLLLAFGAPARRGESPAPGRPSITPQPA
jgi:Zn2+/Cd2+-exporting ATPase